MAAKRPDFVALRKRMTAEHIVKKTYIFRDSPQAAERFISYWNRWIKDEFEQVWDEAERADNIKLRIVNNGDELI